MVSWFQYHLKSFWHQGLGASTNNDYHMRHTNSERNQGTQLAQISLNTMPLPRFEGLWQKSLSSCLPTINLFCPFQEYQKEAGIPSLLSSQAERGGRTE